MQHFAAYHFKAYHFAQYHFAGGTATPTPTITRPRRFGHKEVVFSSRILQLMRKEEEIRKKALEEEDYVIMSLMFNDDE